VSTIRLQTGTKLARDKTTGHQVYPLREPQSSVCDELENILTEDYGEPKHSPYSECGRHRRNYPINDSPKDFIAGINPQYASQHPDWNQPKTTD
jgi:hypothetical protein